MVGPMDDPPIVASGIGFSYEKPVVQGFSLSVRRGEVVAMLGTNGAGKTTIVRMLCGDLRPGTGTVSILGGDPRRPAVRRRMGAMRELPVLNEYLTVGESARYTLGLFGAPRERARAISGVLARFGLGAVEKKRVRVLSKGMMRRLELAQLVLLESPVWVLDEPDSGLDPAGARLFRAEVLAARSRGCAVLFSTHSVLDATSCADRIVVLREGRAAFDGSKADAMERLDKRAFVAAGGGPGLDDALAKAAASAGATLSGPSVPVSDLESFLFEDGAP
jgi:ABC-2 type transport system ATP-binding protein